MKNPFSMQPPSLGGFNMQDIHAPKTAGFNGARVGGIGLKGPWSLNPGSPDFPNHRPYLSNLKIPNPVAPAASQKLKTT